jgi:CMP-N,N'-diacetyllegionaminic acid synthase
LNITCLISARGGSKGVPGKNIKKLLGKPLIGWSIEQAKSCPEIDKVVVSTDSEEIAGIARNFGAEVPFIRPSELAGDTVGKWRVWQHGLEMCDSIYKEPIDVFVDLDCTSPLRDVSDISNSIRQFQREKVDAVFSICEARKNPYFNMLEKLNDRLVLSKCLPKTVTRRQDAPKVFEHVASIYVIDPEYLRKGTGLLSGNVRGYNIGPQKSLDIDSDFDFELIEFLMKKRAGLQYA